MPQICRLSAMIVRRSRLCRCAFERELRGLVAANVDRITSHSNSPRRQRDHRVFVSRTDSDALSLSDRFLLSSAQLLIHFKNPFRPSLPAQSRFVAQTLSLISLFAGYRAFLFGHDYYYCYNCYYFFHSTRLKRRHSRFISSLSDYQFIKRMLKPMATAIIKRWKARDMEERRTNAREANERR